MSIAQPIAGLEKTTAIPERSTYIMEMGDGSGTRAVTQETLTNEVGKGLKVGGLKTKVNDLATNVGDLSGLQTNAKGNLVAAINEAAQSGGSGEQVDILDSKETIEANTTPGKAAGALGVKQMVSALNDNLGGCAFGLTADGRPGWKDGADAVHPFTDIDIKQGSFTSPSGSFTFDCGVDDPTIVIIEDVDYDWVGLYCNIGGLSINIKALYRGQTGVLDPFTIKGSSVTYDAKLTAGRAHKWVAIKL